jgi:hypothetical protein
MPKMADEHMMIAKMEGWIGCGSGLGGSGLGGSGLGGSGLGIGIETIIKTATLLRYLR